MAKKLGEILNSLIIASGIAEDHKDLKALLSNETLSSTPVPDEIATGLLNNLLTIDAAKSNDKVKAHFTKKALDSVDTEIQTFLTSNEYTDLLEEVNKEKSTYKRVQLSLMKVKELEAAKAAAPAADKASLTEKITQLNSEIVKLKDSHVAELKSKDDSVSKKLMGVIFNSTLSDVDFATSDVLSKEDAVELAKLKIKAAIKEKKLKIEANPTYDGLLLTQEDGSPYFEENKQLDFSSFKTKILANSKLLKLSKTDDGPDKGKTFYTPPAGVGKQKNTSAFDAAIDASLEQVS